MRFFGGMNGEEIRGHLDISRRTVVRELAVAEACPEGPRDERRGAKAKTRAASELRPIGLRGSRSTSSRPSSFRGAGRAAYQTRLPPPDANLPPRGASRVLPANRTRAAGSSSWPHGGGAGDGGPVIRFTARHDRRLPSRPPARPGRHGRAVSKPNRLPRRRARPQGDQTPARGHDALGGSARGQILGRLEHEGIARIFEAGIIAAARRRRLHRDGASSKALISCSTSVIVAGHALDPSLIETHRAGRRARAPARHHPPRPQAGEHPRSRGTGGRRSSTSASRAHRGRQCRARRRARTAGQLVGTLAVHEPRAGGAQATSTRPTSTRWASSPTSCSAAACRAISRAARSPRPSTRSSAPSRRLSPAGAAPRP